MIYINHWTCNAEHLWRLSQNDNPSATLWAAMVSDINQDTTRFFNLELQSESKLPQLKTVFVRYANWSFEDRQVNWFIWRPAFYFYIGLGAFLVNYFRTKNIGYLYIALVLSAQVAQFGNWIWIPLDSLFLPHDGRWHADMAIAVLAAHRKRNLKTALRMNKQIETTK